MIAADIVAGLPNLGAIVFEIAPDRVSGFGAAAFLHEMETLHCLWAKTRPSTIASANTTRTVGSGPTPQLWEQAIANRMLPNSFEPSTPSNDDDQAFELYIELAKEFRFGAIADLLKYSVRLLLMALGEPTVRDLLDRYTATVPPTAFPSDEALHFARFVAAKTLSLPGFADILRFETASIEAAADGHTVQITLKQDLGALLDDIAANRIPAPVLDDHTFTLEVGVDPQPFVRLINFEFSLLNPSLIETPFSIP
jgi:hypothetical protein